MSDRNPPGRGRDKVEHYQRLDGLGTRTPIRFGQAMERVIRTTMPSWEQHAVLDSEHYLLYLYRKPVVKEWTGFILIQGARRAGKLTAELAISRGPLYPLQYGRVKPLLAVLGVRDRVGILHDTDDFWWEYRTQEALEERLRDITREIVQRGFYTLDDLYGSALLREIERGQALMDKWRTEDAAQSRRELGSRFPDLMMERPAHEYIHQATAYDSFARCLGPLKARFVDPRWTSCVTYVMASMMEMSDLDPQADFFGALPHVLDDEIHVITGRVPPYVYLKPPETFEERVKMFSFFKALSTAEAFFDEDAG